MTEKSKGRAGGETAMPEQGQEVAIELEDKRPLTKIIVGVGWDPVLGGQSLDIDSAVIVAGEGGYETVYFGELTHPSGCVEHHGDNMTGIDREEGDDESITVYLDKVPKDRDRIIFVLNIYRSFERCQTLRDVRNMYILIYDPATQKPLVEYRLDTADSYDTAVVIGAVYRRGDEWTFKAIGKGSCAADIADFAQDVVNKY